MQRTARPAGAKSCRLDRSRSGMVTGEPVAAPAVERAGANLGASPRHQRHEEMYIVQGEEAQPQDLIGHEEVPDVRAREARAGDAAARLVQRPRVGAELGAL